MTTTSSSLDIIQNKVLGQSIKCTLKDGRITQGTLICLDRLKNMILIDATEERRVLKSIYYIHDDAVVEGSGGRDSNANDGDEENQYYVFRRDISQVLIPGEKLVKVEICDGFKT